MKYGSEAWSVTLREEHRLGLLRMGLRRIFGPERADVTGG
jgi:hypothetical protein